jgi:hypothetical protein
MTLDAVGMTLDKAVSTSIITVIFLDKKLYLLIKQSLMYKTSEKDIKEL